MDRVPITFFGTGRLGLCMALCAERSGFNVLGVDVHPNLIATLNDKTLKSSEPQVTEYLLKAEHFKATLSIEEGVNHAGLIFITVPTPTGIGEKSYDHSILSKVLMQINDLKPKNKHIVVCCTVLPGYISNIGRFLIRDCENATMSYNPEFIAQGDIMHGLVHPDVVLIGECNKEVGDILEKFYKKLCGDHPFETHRMSAESAEITKISINCYITTKIAFANMIGDIATQTPNANAESILRAVGADSRIGYKYLKPGFGFGGPCFPRDNRALGNYARSVGVDPSVPEATDNSNKFHARFQAEKLAAENKDLYIFQDVCYKANCPVPLIDESQKLEVARILVSDKGRQVLIRDRPDVIREVQKDFGNLFEYEERSDNLN